MSAFGLTLPLRIRLVAEAYVVEDANKRVAAYVYFEREPGLASLPRRVAKAEAERIAQTIARALIDEAEHEEPRAGG